MYVIMALFQAVALKASKLGLRRAVKKSRKLQKLLRCLCALPLLPTHEIKAGVLEISELSMELGKLEFVLPLLEYWNRTWLSLVHVLYVYGCADRTTAVNVIIVCSRIVYDRVTRRCMTS